MMMVNLRRNFVYLVCVVVVALILRFYSLSTNPPSLTWDEVAWGYNAYALLHTGKDEFGNFLPIQYLESFGDFKPPVYAYLTVIPVALFGLNEFSTRFVSAFFGSLTVVATYFLVKTIFFSSSRKESYALFSAFFLAISPWHINLSRAAFEANVASFFLIIGVWFFLDGVRRRSYLLTFSAVCFALSFYTFNTSRIVAPLLIIALTVLFAKKLLHRWKASLLAFFIGFALLLPLIPFLLSPSAQLRYREVNIFSDSGPVITANEHVKNNNNAWWSNILDNRRVFYAREYVKHYLDNLDPKFLFISGDGNPKFSSQQVGQLYLFDLPFLIIGALFLFKRKEGYWYFLPIWLLLGIVPAATARETPHALRIETILPVPQILVAYGVVVILESIARISIAKKELIKFGVVGIISLALLINVIYYIHDYYMHYARSFSGEWQYGYKEAFLYAKQNENEYDRIVFTTDLGRPYAYYLFYSKMDPQDFLEDSDVKRDSFGFVSVNRIGNYSFLRDFPKSTRAGEKVLYINSPKKVPGNAVVLKEFRQLDGVPSLVAYWMH
ncbi:MAG: hypothetical protein RLZZ455_1098 [Candidatus Parcubacteria bacterium]|jgi:4-amino-4-deoxy-L-arabinose transferase-like glycosyltransferase